MHDGHLYVYRDVRYSVYMYTVHVRYIIYYTAFEYCRPRVTRVRSHCPCVRTRAHCSAQRRARRGVTVTRRSDDCGSGVGGGWSPYFVRSRIAN